MWYLVLCFPLAVNKRLRKVEAREHKKQLPSAPGILDVQAIMDKAIESRRKVIENSDSDGEESEDDDWGDSDWRRCIFNLNHIF